MRCFCCTSEFYVNYAMMEEWLFGNLGWRYARLVDPKRGCVFMNLCARVPSSQVEIHEDPKYTMQRLISISLYQIIGKTRSSLRARPVDEFPQ